MMATGWYRTRREVQAFQMTSGRERDNSEWPGWMHEAWNLESTEEGAIFRATEGNADSGIMVRVGGDAVLVREDWWLVTGGGRTWAMPDYAFRIMYEGRD